MKTRILGILVACALLLAGCGAQVEQPAVPAPTPVASPEPAQPGDAVQIAMIRSYMGDDCRGSDRGLFDGGWYSDIHVQKLDLECDGETVTGTVEGIVGRGRGDDGYATFFRAAVHGVVGMNDGEPYVESLTYERQSVWTSFYLDRVEQALTNDRKQVVARRWYDLPGLSGGAQVAMRKIEAFFEQDCEEFMADDDLWERIEGRPVPSGQEQFYVLQPFHDTMSTELSYLDEEILSIRQTSYWNAGGMNYTSCYGHTFDLRTGDQLPLDHFVTEDITDFNQWVTDQVCEIGWRREEVEEYYSELTFSDYQYAYDGESVLLFLEEPRTTGSAPILCYQL